MDTRGDNEMRKTLLPLLVIFSFIISLFAWIGSDPTIEIISPDGINDGQEVSIPVKVVVKQKNTEQGIDYGCYYFFCDLDNDGVIDTGEWANRIKIPKGQDINDINQENPFTIDFLSVDKVEEGKYYFIVGVGVDLDGNTSCDTSLIIGETKEGGGSSGIGDKAISWFKIKGKKP